MPFSLFAVIVTGLGAGSLHVLAGPDHLAAVAPLAINQQRRAAWSGLFWGVGHGLGAGLLGLLGLAARNLVDISHVAHVTEFLVGFVLIGIGIWALRPAGRGLRHHHSCDAHGGDESAAAATMPVAAHAHGALWIGALHGMAGTGHLLAVLPSMALPSGLAIAYLAAYFVAAVLSMTLFGLGLACLLRGRTEPSIRRLLSTAGLASIAVGTWWVTTTWPG